MSRMHHRCTRTPGLCTLLLAANPEHLVWGSDWPHTKAAGARPDTPALLGLFREWTSSTHRRECPMQLFGALLDLQLSDRLSYDAERNTLFANFGATTTHGAAHASCCCGST
jgi:hypothetical protein